MRPSYGGPYFCHLTFIRKMPVVKDSLVSVTTAEEIWGLSNLRIILYGPWALPFLNSAIMHSTCVVSVGERKKEDSVFLPK